MQKRTISNNKKQSKMVQNVSVKKATKTPQEKNTRKRVKYECSEELAEMIQQANILPKDFHFSFESLLENSRSGEPLLLRWCELFLSLPEEIKGFIVMSDEKLEYKKNDAREFWRNNDGEAQDTLNDMCSDNQITDEEFNKIINADIDEIADFLVDSGFYGESYSYTKQVERKKKDSFNNFSSFSDYYDDEKLSDTDNLVAALPYIQALERLQSIRDFLLAIVNLAEISQKSFSQISQTESDYQVREHHERFTKNALQQLATKQLKEKVLATSININKNNEIEFSVSEWATVLNGIDITRIRICEICEKIFWANRKDAFACSKKHSKVRQMRLLRTNWKKSGQLYVKARKNKLNKTEEK